jgi:hypothetical protein
VAEDAHPPIHFRIRNACSGEKVAGPAASAAMKFVARLRPRRAGDLKTKKGGKKMPTGEQELPGSADRKETGKDD